MSLVSSPSLIAFSISSGTGFLPIFVFLKPLNISSGSTSPFTPFSSFALFTASIDDEKPNSPPFGLELHAEGKVEDPLAVMVSRLWLQRVPFAIGELSRVRLIFLGQSDELEAF